MDYPYQPTSQYFEALPGSLGPLAEIEHRDKRPKSDSGDTTRPSSQNDKPESKHGKDAAVKLACPFCKRRPDLWGDIGECGTYSNPHITTIVRHHVLDKHQKINESLSKDDPRWIEPRKFQELIEWRNSVPLKQSQAKQLWTTMFMKLFDLSEAQRTQVPSPEFTVVLADDANSQIDLHLRRKLLAEPYFDVEGHMTCLSILKREVERQRDIEHRFIDEYFAPQLRQIEVMRRDEWQRCEERCSEKLGALYKAYMNDHKSMQQPSIDMDIQFAGSAPSQVVLSTPPSWQGMAEGFSFPTSAPDIPDIVPEPTMSLRSPYTSAVLRSRPHAQMYGVPMVGHGTAGTSSSSSTSHPSTQTWTGLQSRWHAQGRQQQR